MKKIFFIILSIALAWTQVWGEDIEYAHSYKQALSDAKEHDKLVLVFFDMDGCPACEYMKDVTFDDELVSGYLNAHYIVYRININEKAPQGLKAYGTPTMYFLDKNGNKIGRQIVGGLRASGFMKHLKQRKQQASKP